MRSVGGLFAFSLIFSAIMAPPIFNALLWLGRHVDRLKMLRDVEFESVVSRCFLVLMILGCIPFMKGGGMGHVVDLGFQKDISWLKKVLKGLSTGCLTMAGLFLLGWGLNAYTLKLVLPVDVVIKLSSYFVGALIVGVLEETFFRGFLFGVLRRPLGYCGGLLLSSLIFSVIHFAKPNPAIGVVYGHWYSGLALFPSMFRFVGPSYHYFPFFLTLFFMGMIMCVFYDLHHHIYFIIGLHAGWVFIMRTGKFLFERNPNSYLYLFGHSSIIEKSYSALIMALIFSAGVLYWRRSLKRFEVVC